LGGTLLVLNLERHTMYYLISIPMILGTPWILLLSTVRAKIIGWN
jgi:hypothetical protein